MKWSVRKLPGNRAWGIYDDNGNLHDAEPEHADAMDWAHWYSSSKTSPSRARSPRS